MKTVFRVLIFGLFAVVFTAATTTSTLAQNACDVNAARVLFAKVTDNMQSQDLAEVRLAIASSKEFIQKYASCADFIKQIEYLKLPSIVDLMNKSLRDLEAEAARQQRYATFNSSLKNKNWDALYRVGPAILVKEPGMIDVVIVLGYAGLESRAHHDATIKYAKMAIQKLNGGVTSKNYGAVQFEFKSKDNAIGFFNYAIGRIMVGRNNPSVQKQGLDYLFKAANANSDSKKMPQLYGAMGDYYKNKSAALSAERLKLDVKDESKFAEIDNLFGLEKAYAERAADAYARAFSHSQDAGYRKTLFDLLKVVYSFRFNKEGEPPITDVDAKVTTYVAKVVSTPLPNPASAVTPVIEKEPVTTDTVDSTTGETGRDRTVSKKKPGTH